MLPPNLDYPVRVDIDYAPDHNRLTTFFRFPLVIPHYLALVFVGILAFFVVVMAWFATLFTGRYPRSLFDFLAGVIRWSLRVGAYNLLLTDRYPPFSLADNPDYPVRVTFDHPEHIANWRPLVNWILILPFAYAAGAVLYAAYFVSIAAWFMVVFTGRYPDGMFSFMGVALRWTARQQVFQLWMTERYPPFEWA